MRNTLLTLAIAAAAFFPINALAQNGNGNGGGANDPTSTCDGSGPGGGIGNSNGGGMAGNGSQQGYYGMHGQQGMGTGGVLLAYLETLEPATLSAAEMSGIQWMREEEKLARDVYTVLYDTWRSPVFIRIAGAEQRHMDLMAYLIDRYDILDPAADTLPGFFTDPDLASLYTQLVARGESSFIEALQVGALIEDLDLHDVYSVEASTDNMDLAAVYNNLAKGSRNHLRAFVGLLSDQGVTWTPTYLDDEIAAEILESPRERRVVYDADGNALDMQAFGCLGQGGQAAGNGNGNGNGIGNGECDGTGSGNDDCDGTGSGNGEGTGNGNGDGTGNGNGDGTGNGNGDGTGNGNGDGTGNGNGDGTGNGNGDGSGSDSCDGSGTCDGNN